MILDGGYDAGRKVILDLLRERIELAAQGKLNKDYKTRLQEKLQDKSHGVQIIYRITDQSGPDHSKQFTVQVEANGKILGSGTGPSKSKAEQAAAENALSKGVC